MKRIFLVLFLFGQTFVLSAQSQLNNLYKQVKNCKQDTCSISRHMDIAFYYYKNDKPDSVNSNFDQIYTLSRKLLDTKESLDSSTWQYLYNVNNIISGYYLYKAENYPLAIRFLETAKSFGQKLNNNAFLGKTYNRIGLAHEFMGEYEKAIAAFRKSNDFYQKAHKDRRIAANYIEIANVYGNWQQDNKALENYQRALEQYQSVNDSTGISGAYQGLANVYSRQGNYSKALQYEKASLAIEKKLQNADGIVLALGNIGSTLLNTRNYANALSFTSDALKISQTNHLEGRTAMLLHQMGIIYKQMNQFERALDYLQQSLELAKKIHFKKIEQADYKDLAEVYYALGKYRNAYQTTEAYHALKDSIFNKEKYKQLATLETKYETAEKNKKILLQKKELESKELKIRQEQILRYFMIAGLLLTVLISIYVFYNYKQKKKANILLAKNRDEIQKQRDNIEEKKKLIEKIYSSLSESIDYARRLQSSVLPNEDILQTYLIDYFLLYKPKDKVSGDFYWWYHTEGHTIITAADCTGHGVPGAFMSMLGITFLREIVMKSNITDPPAILNELRNEIIKTLDQKGKQGEQKDGMDIALVNIDHSNLTVRYAGAYNPIYIIRKKRNDTLLNLDTYSEIASTITNDEYALFEMKADKMPIAIHERMKPFVGSTIQLESGDRLYLFSDGFVDQFGGPKGKKLKSKQFKRLLLKLSTKSLSEQKRLLLDFLQNWKKDYAQIDDIIIIGMEL